MLNTMGEIMSFPFFWATQLPCVSLVSYQSRYTPLKNACNGWAQGGSTKIYWSRRGCTWHNKQYLYTRL